MSEHPTPVRLQTTAAMGLTTTQTAELLGVAVGSIRRWADAGRLECYRLPSGHRRFNRTQLERFLGTLHDD